MKTIYFILGLFIVTINTYGQDKFLTKQGYTSFFSNSTVENIKAENNQVLSIIDTSNGAIAIAILMKSFLFEKSLMQEHFNENYVESDIYPKAIFKGQIIDFSTISEGKNEVSIQGKITIHGVTKEIQTKASITKTKDHILLDGKFPITVADFDIEIPSLVANNIAKVVDVTFTLDHKPYTK